MHLKLKYNRKGDPTVKSIVSNFEVIKKLATEKIDLIKGKPLGKKCLVIVPPGNNCEIAHHVEKHLGDEAIALVGGGDVGGWDYRRRGDPEIEKFRTDPKLKFLVVVNKCQIGFDMPELTSTIDLTMTQNISLLIQRWGRLARKGPDGKKNFYYVIDDGMTAEEAEWMLATSIDYAMGNFSETKSKRLKYHRTALLNVGGGKNEFSVGFRELLSRFKGLDHSQVKSVSFKEETTPSGFWSIEKLKEEARRFESRTELSEKARYIYNQLKKHYPEALEEVFPRKVKVWTPERALEVAKTCKGRKDFKLKHPGAYWRLQSLNRLKDLDEIFGKVAVNKAYTRKKAIEIARTCKNRSEFKSKAYNAYYMMLEKYPKDLDEIFGERYSERA